MGWGGLGCGGVRCGSLTSSPTPGMDPGVRCHGTKGNSIGYPWYKYEYFLTTGCQDIDF